MISKAYPLDVLCLHKQADSGPFTLLRRGGSGGRIRPFSPSFFFFLTQKKTTPHSSQQTFMSSCNARKVPRLITAICWKKDNSKLSRYHRSQRKTHILAVSVTPGCSDLENESICARWAVACRPFVGVYQQMCGQLGHARAATGGADLSGGWRVAESASTCVSVRLSMLARLPCLVFFNGLGEEGTVTGWICHLSRVLSPRPGLLVAPGVWQATGVIVRILQVI